MNHFPQWLLLPPLIHQVWHTITNKSFFIPANKSSPQPFPSFQNPNILYIYIYFFQNDISRINICIFDFLLWARIGSGADGSAARWKRHPMEAVKFKLADMSDDNPARRHVTR